MKLAEKIIKLLEASTLKDLQKNKVKMSEEERTEAMDGKAVWHHGPNGEETCAIWKSNDGKKDCYVCNTHRLYNVSDTLKGAIENYHNNVKDSA